MDLNGHPLQHRDENLDKNNDGILPWYKPSDSQLQPKMLQPPLLMVHSVTVQQQPREVRRQDRRSRRGRREEGEVILGLRGRTDRELPPSTGEI